MKGWRDIHVGFEGDGLKIGGVEVWKREWRRTGEPHLNLPHPSYQHQIHRYDIYEIGDAGHSIRFAAGELSYGVWGFYVPETDQGESSI
jgi:hypothetical protein